MPRYPLMLWVAEEGWAHYLRSHDLLLPPSLGRTHIQPACASDPTYHAKRNYAIVDLEGAVSEVLEGINGSLPCCHMEFMVRSR